MAIGKTQELEYLYSNFIVSFVLFSKSVASCPAYFQFPKALN